MLGYYRGMHWKHLGKRIHSYAALTSITPFQDTLGRVRVKLGDGCAINHVHMKVGQRIGNKDRRYFLNVMKLNNL